MFEKRIIIGGLPRSGSTLLKNILDSHPSIVCGHEAGIFIRPYEEQLKDIGHFTRRFERIYGIRRGTTKKIMKKSKTSIECFDNIMEVYCEKNKINKTIWADKTPRNCLNYQNIHQEDPEVYFLSTVRDGRDVVTSKKPPQTAYWCSVERYVETMRAVYAFTKGRHLFVRYEDLIQDSEVFFKQLMDFLDLPFYDNMLTDYQELKITSAREQAKTRNPITRQWVGRWREERHRDRITEFMSNPEAVHWLKHSGYDVDG